MEEIRKSEKEKKKRKRKIKRASGMNPGPEQKPAAAHLLFPESVTSFPPHPR
jgi:hypothetical protein